MSDYIFELRSAVEHNDAIRHRERFEPDAMPCPCPPCCQADLGIYDPHHIDVAVEHVARSALAVHVFVFVLSLATSEET